MIIALAMKIDDIRLIISTLIMPLTI